MDYVKIPEILLPNQNIPIEKWAVIACDQFTSQPQYWDELNRTVGDYSTLRLIYPECYLGEAEGEKRIAAINATMNDYLANGVFRTVEGLILVVRTTRYGHRRIGLMLSVDLDAYDYVKGGLAIRATEAVVTSRIPPRVNIRKGAAIELPHLLLLIDDKDKTVIEPLYQRRGSLTRLYSSELNKNGGSIEGYLVDDANKVIENLYALLDEDRLQRSYGSRAPFLFAVGDGNHSLAAAKACWEALKPTLTPKERVNHPARYCLAEVNNLHDPEMLFEPIHRVVKGGGKEFNDALITAMKGEKTVEAVYEGKSFSVKVPKDSAEAIKVLQDFIDGYIATNSGVTQDYVHGKDNALGVAASCGGTAILFPSIDKDTFFSYVANHGELTRKSFSMGEAEEKRYYLESKRIK